MILSPDPTHGLDKAARTALCDASYGLLGLIDGCYRRQTSTHFMHGVATIDALVESGLLRSLGNDVVAITPLGRKRASRIRQRRAAIADWDRRCAQVAGARRTLEHAHG